MVDFELQILSYLESEESATLSKPDSEMLTSDTR